MLYFFIGLAKIYYCLNLAKIYQICLYFEIKQHFKKSHFYILGLIRKIFLMISSYLDLFRLNFAFNFSCFGCFLYFNLYCHLQIKTQGWKVLFYCFIAKSQEHFINGYFFKAYGIICLYFFAFSPYFFFFFLFFI